LIPFGFIGIKSKKGKKLKIAESILKSASISALIIEERKFKDIVIGVPHHAPAGIEKLPCLEHPESDENAGYLGRYIAEKLKI